jgi:hypothetical protein
MFERLICLGVDYVSRLKTSRRAHAPDPCRGQVLLCTRTKIWPPCIELSILLPKSQFSLFISNADGVWCVQQLFSKFLATALVLQFRSSLANSWSPQVYSFSLQLEFENRRGKRSTVLQEVWTRADHHSPDSRARADPDERDASG